MGFIKYSNNTIEKVFENSDEMVEEIIKHIEDEDKDEENIVEKENELNKNN